MSNKQLSVFEGIHRVKGPGNSNVLFLSGFLSRDIHYSQNIRGKGRLQRRIQNQIEHVEWS